MIRAVAFTSRIVVFAVITAVGLGVIPTEDMLVDRSLRLSISALQVLSRPAAGHGHHVDRGELVHAVRCELDGDL